MRAGQDGALWCSEEFKNKVGRITTDGVITEYPIPTPDSNPGDITTGPDGALWFIEQSGFGNQIGRITTDGVITEFPVPTPFRDLGKITTGPDGALWFTHRSTALSQIGRITTAGVITEFQLPTPGTVPTDITAGPDGALWFSEELNNKIGRITTDGGDGAGSRKLEFSNHSGG